MSPIASKRRKRRIAIVPLRRRSLTPTDGFLRRCSSDELPLLFSASGGELSLGGPHSVLFNQDDLIALRTKPGVHGLRPIFGPGTVISGGRERTLLAETTPKALRWVTIVDLRMKLRFRSSPPAREGAIK